MTEPRPPMVSPGSVPACSICGAARTVHESVRGPVCADRTCQVALIQQQKKAEKDAFERTCDAIAESFSRTVRTPAVRQRVPYLDRKVLPTPDSEKRAFRATLREALRETARRAAKGEAKPIAERDEPASRRLDASCIACRGYCCRQGAGHAFLKPEYLPTVLARRPRDAPAAVYRDYVRRIPAASMDGACLYQGEEGCVLPRDMRSWICNDFECRDRLSLKGALLDAPETASLVIAMDGQSVKSAALTTPAGELTFIDPDAFPDRDDEIGGG